MPFINAFSGPGNEFLGIAWPSGQVGSGDGSNLEAYLVSLRANFGFNSEPHQFELDFIPTNYINVTYPASGHGHGASGNLAPINQEIEMWVSGFYIKGTITHIDWHSNENGTVLNVGLRDKRTTLDRYKLTTDDIGENIPSGIISISREFRKLNNLTQLVSRDWLTCDGSGTVSISGIETNDNIFLEYKNIISYGATYRQILNAITNIAGSGYTEILPSIADIEGNIGGDIDSLRFQLGNTTIREFISQLTLRTSFDWYWHMGNESVALINRKTPFSVREDEILNLINAFGGSGIDNVTSVSYGKDIVDEPSKVHLLGAHQEGMMNSALLSPIDGLDTIYDNLAPSSTLVFRAAWPFLTVGFYDADGFYRTYIPTEKELQMAIAGPEQWTYFKKYQTASAPSGWAMPADAGSIAAQHPDFQSRLDPRMPIAELLNNPPNNIRVINNRRDINSNWVLDFINRVNQHAQRHYGKSYIATNALTRDDKVFRLIDSAWCNVENQKENPSGLFEDDYEISRTYGPVAPFILSEGKITAHVKLPSGTVYGPLGEDTPAAFSNWTEDAPPFNPSGDGSHYIPCDLAIVGGRVQDVRNNDEFSFETFPEQTIWCQLPEIAASGMEQDDVLGSLATLTEIGLALQQSGIIDLIDPRKVIKPYNCLSGVAVPVQSTERYGQTYPSIWTSGEEHPIFGTKIEIEDNLAPWITFPQGTETSIDKLNRYAFDTINASIVNQQESQFLEITQVGLPMISFDSFANQSPNLSGLVGERSHGVNFVSIDYGTDGLRTTYKIQSYFSNINSIYPLAERTRFRINGIINPIDFSDIGDFIASIGPGRANIDPNIRQGFNNAFLNLDFERQETCIVIAVHNIFNQQAAERLMNGQSVPAEERYYAVVARRRTFGYGETNYTLQPGINNIGHNLNSLNVTVTFVASGIGLVPMPFIELDPYTVAVSNNTGSTLFGTILVGNGEGIIRPTNGTIRRSSEVDDYGAVCNDGYLNLGDVCTYVHKRVDGEELAYFLGGRPLQNGMIVQVERIEGNGLYSVSLLGDRHGRWIAGIPALNNTPLSVGQQMPIAPTA